jgi:hypothetical protein
MEASRVNKFPVSISAVKDYGIERWQKDCPAWPVSGEEFMRLSADIDKLYTGIIFDSPPEIGDVLTILYKLAVEYEMFIHALIVVQRLRRDDFTVDYGDSALHYDALVGDRPGIHGLFHYYSKLCPRIPSLKQVVRGRINSTAFNWRHGAWERRREAEKGIPFLATRPPGSTLKCYATRHKRRIQYFYPFPITSVLHSKADAPASRFGEVADQMLCGLQVVASSYGVQLKPEHVRYLHHLTTDCSQAAWCNYELIKRVLVGYEPTSILAQSLGGTLARTVCVAGRAAGHRIVGAVHGNSAGIRMTRNAMVTVDLSIVDEYLVPTRGAAELFSKASEANPLSACRKPKISSCRKDAYGELWKKHRREPLPSAINTVMLLEYPMNELRCRLPWGFWPDQLALTLRSALLLRQHGFRTIIKRHPDRLQESEGLYDEYFDELITERFEAVYEMADAYIFPNTATTTFGFALLTNRPVIFFEAVMADLWEDVHKSLRRRCRIIPSRLDPRKGIVFDEDALVDALRKRPEEPDTEFVEKYMLS